MIGNIVNSIFVLLEPFNDPNIPITLGSLRKLNQKELTEFYDFLIRPLNLCQNNISRPQCPVKDINHSSLARFPYKKNIVDYIAQWSYEFKNPAVVSLSLLEATANYLEQNKLN